MSQIPDLVNSTSRSDTPSDASIRQRTFAVILWLSLSVMAYSQVSREEALERAYPEATIRAERVFLTDGQMRDARALSGVDVESALVARYIAVKDGKVQGRAYVDTHVVRTKRESLLICLDENGRVKRVELTAFLEPPEYKAASAWYEQFNEKPLDDSLNLNRAIRHITGATLTSIAGTRAVRRVLAIDRVLSGGAGRYP